ncbi:MAG: hypothetical protein ACRDWB_07735 [Acidimicrobiales bacterium]
MTFGPRTAMIRIDVTSDVIFPGSGAFSPFRDARLRHGGKHAPSNVTLNAESGTTSKDAGVWKYSSPAGGADLAVPLGGHGELDARLSAFIASRTNENGRAHDHRAETRLTLNDGSPETQRCPGWSRGIVACQLGKQPVFVRLRHRRF